MLKMTGKILLSCVLASLISDFVISDYSTSIFDFVLLGKPAFVCAMDIDEYEHNRGLLKEFYDFPFPFSRSNEELIECIRKFNKSEYEQKINSYFGEHPMFDKGYASMKTAEWILSKMM